MNENQSNLSVRDQTKVSVTAYIRALGFDLVRISPAALPERYDAAFRRWIASSQHGDMTYLSRRLEDDRRPDTILPGVQSVIALAVNYYQDSSTQRRPDEGQVSRYAVTRDYHKIIRTRLKKIARYLEDEFGARSRYYVDTGPVLERAFAEVAGVGYIGRNTCVITERFGSWVFLAAVLTTLDLQADESNLKINCGACTRCIDACPTGAINADHTIDARKCISYLTIENRGGIPHEYRDQVGAWLFGCDICQDVCPHNGRAVQAELEDFAKVRIGDRVLRLSEILGIRTDEAFLERFAGTPLMRAKRRGLIRNACVVAGNSGLASLLPALAQIVGGDDTMLAEHAEWAIARIQDATKSTPT